MDWRQDRRSSSSCQGRNVIESARASASRLAATLAFDQPPADILPGYQIIDEIHRGGQGVVYRAVQEATHRQVAIKLMHEGPFAGLHGRVRFEREVRILAQLRHPNIVTIHDSGTAGGTFYFVMAYIQGRTLDNYVEAAKLSIREMLGLFLTICQAVNAAHLRGVIHRDLKPGNILVNESGEPYILDFGLAKMAAETDDVTRSLGMTIPGQFVGSLQWASPEQADGAPGLIDLRSDVYSLGVMLYQMLTNRFPYDVVGKMREVLGRILAAEPIRPRTIRKGIDDELETIVLKCLVKDPERRYQSAGELARDIRHYLANEPIEAKRDSTLYVLRKQFHRHRAIFGTGLIFLITVCGFAIWMTTLYAQANSSEAAAVRESRTNEAILSFLIQDMIAAAKPEVSRGQDLTAHDQLLAAAQNVENAFPDAPAVRAKVHGYIGDAFAGLGDAANARRHFEIALDEITSDRTRVCPDALNVRLRLIDLGYDNGRAASLKPEALELLDDCYHALGPHAPNTLEAMFQLARIYWILGDPEDAADLNRQVLAERRELFGPEHPATVKAFVQWIQTDLNSKGAFAEAAKQYREVYQLSCDTLGKDHPSTLVALATVAKARALERHLIVSGQLYQEAIAGLRRVCGDAHPYTVTAQMDYAHCVLSVRAQDNSAVELLRDTLATIDAANEPIESLRASCAYFLGMALARTRHFAEAVKVHRVVVSYWMNNGGQGTSDATAALGALAFAEENCGMFDSAELHYRRAFEVNMESFGPGYGDTMWEARSYLRMLSRRDDTDRARPIADMLLSSRRMVADRPDAVAYTLNCCAREYLDVFPEDLRDASVALEYAKKAYARSGDEYHYNRYTLARAHMGVGDREEAVKILNLALQHCPLEVSTERHLYVAELARILSLDGRVDEAVDVYRSTLAKRLDADPQDARGIGFAKYDLAIFLIDRGETMEARKLLEEFLDITDEHLDRASRVISSARVALAKLLLTDDEFDAAERMLLSAFERCTENDVPLPMIAQESALALSGLYDRVGRKGLSDQYRVRAARRATSESGEGGGE